MRQIEITVDCHCCNNVQKVMKDVPPNVDITKVQTYYLELCNDCNLKIGRIAFGLDEIIED